MKLFLLRHAKSAWRSFENDHDRALSERGLRDAKTLAEHISNSQISFLVRYFVQPQNEPKKL